MRILFCVIMSFLFMFPPVFSLDVDNIEVLSGYLDAPLKELDRYKAVPFLVSFNFDGKSKFEKATGMTVKGDLYFGIEPFLNAVFEPNANIEVGVDFLAKYVFPLDTKIKPYLKGGLGVLYMSQHTYEQATQYNFLPQLGIGFSCRINDTAAVNLEYRYRHLSNANFKRPNAGIDAELFLVGMTFHF